MRKVKKLAGGAVRALNPAITLLMVRDLLGSQSTPGESSKHLEGTIKWLCRAQDHGVGGGVSGGFSVLEGWLAPYPETTGYIIPTFYDYAAFSDNDELRERARKMADWELEVQMPSGAVQAGLYRGKQAVQHPAVFNTGQVILGWCRAFIETRDERYLRAAQRAGEWLIEVQHSDGGWHLASSETETTLHAYDARTAWSLLEIYKITGEQKYLESARRQLNWVLGRQVTSGWFDNNAFFVFEGNWTDPHTHTIAYVMEGLLESYLIVRDEKYLEATQKAADKLLRIFELKKFMAGQFDQNWRTDVTYSCLTGNAQIAGVWLKLFQITHDTRYLSAALKLNDYTKSTQSLHSLHGGIRGGIKGSQPIYGSYTRFIYVNWGAKFFADTLLLELKAMAEFERAVMDCEALGPGDISTRTAQPLFGSIARG